jgi:hypothetical protein
MPSSSKKQHDFMEAIAHNKAFAKKVHVPQSVGRDFAEADKGKHFKRGGDMAMNPKAAMAMSALMGGAKRPRPMAKPMAAPAAPPMAMPGMKHGGLTKKHHEHLAHHHLAMAEHHHAMCGGGMAKKMKHGGEAMEPHTKDMGIHGLKHGGKAKHHYAKGGHVPGQYPLGEKMEKVTAGGHKGHGEHSIQERGHTRALQEKMKGNTVGNGPIVNAKKHGGKIHHKK